MLWCTIISCQCTCISLLFFVFCIVFKKWPKQTIHNSLLFFRDKNFCSKTLFLCQFLGKNMIKHWHLLRSADNVKDQRCIKSTKRTACCFIKMIFKVKSLPSKTHYLMLRSNGIKCNILSRSWNSFIQKDEHADNSPRSEKTRSRSVLPSNKNRTSTVGGHSLR